MKDLILDQSSPRSFPFDYPVTTRVKMVKEVKHSIGSYQCKNEILYPIYPWEPINLIEKIQENSINKEGINHVATCVQKGESDQGK